MAENLTLYQGGIISTRLSHETAELDDDPVRQYLTRKKQCIEGNQTPSILKMLEKEERQNAAMTHCHYIFPHESRILTGQDHQCTHRGRPRSQRLAQPPCHSNSSWLSTVLCNFLMKTKSSLVIKPLPPWNFSRNLLCSL